MNLFQSKQRLKVKDGKAKSKNTLQLFLLAVPAILIILVFNYFPMLGIIIAFKNVNYVNGPLKSPWVGLDNFKFFFTSDDAWLCTRNTLGYNFLFIIVGTIAAIIFAMLINEVRNIKAIKYYQTVYFFPYFFSWIIVTYVVYSLVSSPYGILISTFKNIGLDISDFYTNTKYWPVFLVIVYLWKSLGYMSIIFYAGIMGIQNEYYEAAAIDGASRFQMAYKITLPFLTPLITILTLLSIGKIFYSDFGLFYFVPREIGALYSVTQVIDTYVYRTLKVTSDIGMSSAIGLYQSLVGFLLVIFSNAIVRKIDPENSIF